MTDWYKHIPVKEGHVLIWEVEINTSDPHWFTMEQADLMMDYIELSLDDGIFNDIKDIDNSCNLRITLGQVLRNELDEAQNE